VNRTFNRPPVIGVMGGASVDPHIMQLAYELGARIAENGWVLLNGGRDAGVMRASAQGAKSKGGMTIGILPGDSKDQASPFIDIPIVTNMGDARNVINILSSDVVVALPGSAGTISEIALALKNKKRLIFLQYPLNQLLSDLFHRGQLVYSDSVSDCIACIQKWLIQ
jgi:uncharacterized protein (TIGR00725 family)